MSVTGNTVWFNEQEIERGRVIARSRRAHTSKRRRADRRVSTRGSDDLIDFVGVMGEWAFRRWFEWPEFLEERRVNPGWTLEVTGGCRVQIKATLQPGRRIIQRVSADEGMRADIVVLVEPLDDTYAAWRLAGWATRTHWIANRTLDNSMTVPNFVLERHQMLPMGELRTWLGDERPGRIPS